MRINCFKGIVTGRSDTAYNVGGVNVARGTRGRQRTGIIRCNGGIDVGFIARKPGIRSGVSPPFPYSYRRPDLTIRVEIGGGRVSRSRVAAAIGNRDL